MKHQIIVIALLIMVTGCMKAQKTNENEKVQKTNENIFSMKVGAGQLYLLSEGQRNGSPEILIGANPEIIKQYAPDNAFPSATNAFLWQVDGENFLFDTGYGKELFNNLQSLEVKPEDIDAIFITHAHGDHIGGLLRNDQAAFPKAAIYMSQSEYDYWTNDEIINQLPENNRGGFILAKKVVAAYKDHLHLFEPNAINPPYDKELCHGIKAIAAYGHTPGHTVFLLESGNDKLLIWGDLTHAMAIQMPHPEIAVTYDTNPDSAIQSRSAVLKFVSDSVITIAGMHIAYPGIGAIEKSDPGYRFIPAQ
ncbi:MAG: MBL fold metallo-hydrolase [Candidatus Azobacteroides sp.]|nr:MBL fold metallo-hydrolase [Candidatus Azobacteroides sp.]